MVKGQLGFVRSGLDENFLSCMPKLEVEFCYLSNDWGDFMSDIRLSGVNQYMDENTVTL